MKPTTKALRQTARQLNRAYWHAALAGHDAQATILIHDPRGLIGLLRRAARELER